MAINRQQRRAADRAARKARALGRPVAVLRCVICDGPANGPRSAVAQCECGAAHELLPPGHVFCEHCAPAVVAMALAAVDEGHSAAVCLDAVAGEIFDCADDPAFRLPPSLGRRVAQRLEADLFRHGLCTCPGCLAGRGRVQ